MHEILTVGAKKINYQVSIRPTVLMCIAAT